MSDAAAAAAAAATPWFAAVTDTEIVGHAQTKGWDKLEPAVAFTAAAKAHREAEARLGIPADQVLRMPKPDDEAAVKAFWQKFGAPEKPEGYEFPGVKFEDEALTTAFTDTLRATAARLNLPKDAAAQVAADVAKLLTGREEAAKTKAASDLIEQKEALAKNWGSNVEANTFVAKQAAKALGPEIASAVEKLEGLIGYAPVMEMFRKIGEGMGEAKFVTGDRGGKPGVMTREQAVVRKADLMRDGEWTKRYNAGGTEENKELKALNSIITGLAW